MSKMIQIRHVPDELHAKLKARAAAAGMTLTDYLLSEMRLLADTPTLEELTARIREQEPLDLGDSSAQIIREMRDVGLRPARPGQSSADLIREMREAGDYGHDRP
jgi:plasmid stability protein